MAVHPLQLPTEQESLEDKLLREVIDWSEDALAQLFIKSHGNEFRFVASWNSWLRWNGRRWAIDDSGKAELFMQNIMRRVANKLFKQRVAALLHRGGKWEIGAEDRSEERRFKMHMARRSAAASTFQLKSSTRRDGALKMARPEKPISATVDIWDSDPWLFNTPRGVVDLRTGKLQPHAPEFFMTKMARVAPIGGPWTRALTPLWSRFLQQITQDDPEFESYIQRVCGYCLTGVTHDQALFFIHGPGGSGKSTLTNIMGWIMGDYTKPADMETFLAIKGTRHPTDLAKLCGARFVTASETEQGRRWNESRIKEITGGDPISARFMKQDFFEYIPQFKLVIIGNHRPAFSNVNEAIRRRLHLLPFTFETSPESRDKYLGDKLQKEAEGILQWAIEGCLEYRRLGLSPPSRVITATDSYLADEDSFRAWLQEKCEWDSTAFTPSRDLFASWAAWAQSIGEPPGTHKDIKYQIEERAGGRYLWYGVVRDGGTTVRGYRGIRLKIRPSVTATKGEIVESGQSLPPRPRSSKNSKNSKKDE